MLKLSGAEHLPITVKDAGAPARAGPTRPWRRRLVLVVAAVAVGSALGACGGGATRSTGGTPILNWYVFHDPSGSFPAAAKDCSAAAGGAYGIRIQELPTSADGQRQQLVRRSAAKDSSLDILGLDVVWEAEFAEAGWVENWTGQRRQQVERDAVKAALDTATWNGQLVAAPFNSNTQLLWYRKDLVPDPPRTWDQMIRQAQELARQGKPHYIEIQGNSYEGYTVWVKPEAGAVVRPPQAAPVQPQQRSAPHPLSASSTARADACQVGWRRWWSPSSLSAVKSLG